ncbi:MAG: SprT-like domain-containing protein [Bdellovibrionales bacterium]
MTKAFEHLQDWESRALVQLYHDYKSILVERRLRIRPAALEIFDSETHWGQWDSQTSTIRLSRRLLKTQPWFLVLGVLKHEMAHQIVDQTGSVDPGGPHGPSFQAACEALGLPLEFRRATLDLMSDHLDWRAHVMDSATERLMEKVRRLLALAESTNEHEALAAMQRVRELFARHQLESGTLDARGSYVHRVLTRRSKRLEAYEKKLVSLLVSHFFVQVIAGTTYDAASGDHFRSLEIIGTRESVLMAEYVYEFLLQQCEDFVRRKAQASRVSLSSVERKSYRLGLLMGFEEKLRLQEQAEPKGEVSVSNLSRALLVFRSDKKLDSYLRQIYPRLRNLSSRGPRVDRAAFQEGRVEGRKITLNKPITSTQPPGPTRLISQRRT